MEAIVVVEVGGTKLIGHAICRDLGFSIRSRLKDSGARL